MVHFVHGCHIQGYAWVIHVHLITRCYASFVRYIFQVHLIMQSIDKIANSVVDKLIKGDSTTEHEGEEHFNVDLIHDTDNEAEMDIKFITAGSYSN